MTSDLFGLGWREELAAGILAHRDEIDLVEVIAETATAGGTRRLRALRTLSREIPVLIHGVSLGLASSLPVDEKRLSNIARVVEAVEPPHWSEHLAFVRAGGWEIGHLAAPPRAPATLEGLARNLERARRVVGTLPWLENIATLIAPPGSSWGEVEWTQQVFRQTGAGLLLDLHNLYANAVNFGASPSAVLDALPLDRVQAVHLAGGRWIGPADRRRLLDDHLHPVPTEVFELLAQLGSRVPHPLHVIIERDGAYPPIETLLCELREARAALARGREHLRTAA